MIISAMAFRGSVAFIDRNWPCSFYLAVRCNEPFKQARQISMALRMVYGFEFGTLNVQETTQIGFLKTRG